MAGVWSFTHCSTVLGSTRARDIMGQVCGASHTAAQYCGSTRARDIMGQVCGASHTAAQYWGPLELGT